MNTFIILGRIDSVDEVKETSSGHQYREITVREARPYKNSEGNYDFDTHEITLWKSLAKEELKVGDQIMIRGRIQSYDYVKDERVYHNSELVAERISQYAA
ncbi:MAG: single-stranded DNA-binding protein [Erysipelotrichaceae bacterium]|nr:single-stranded DNA-binding protein [Erysipelotrichaceae bacterium]